MPLCPDKHKTKVSYLLDIQTITINDGNSVINLRGGKKRTDLAVYDDSDNAHQPGAIFAPKYSSEKADTFMQLDNSEESWLTVQDTARGYANKHFIVAGKDAKHSCELRTGLNDEDLYVLRLEEGSKLQGVRVVGADEFGGKIDKKDIVIIRSQEASPTPIQFDNYSGDIQINDEKIEHQKYGDHFTITFPQRGMYEIKKTESK